jgi:glutamate-1-semialdehyde 2,1-aminomutase
MKPMKPIDRQRAVAEARRRYAEKNPASRERFEAARAALPGGNTRTVLFHEPFPLGIARGDGCRIWDADGHEYLNLVGEYTAGLFGHSNPVILAAIRRALDGGLSLSGHNMVEGPFARAVSARFRSMELLRFTNSGTEANLLALATAVLHTGRRRILVFDGGYHGSVLSFHHGSEPLNVPHDFWSAPTTTSPEPGRSSTPTWPPSSWNRCSDRAAASRATASSWRCCGSGRRPSAPCSSSTR